MSQDQLRDAREHINGLTQSKRGLLERLVSNTGSAARISPGPPVREQRGPCVLSSNQGRQWFLERLYTASGAYNMGGPLDLDELPLTSTGKLGRRNLPAPPQPVRGPGTERWGNDLESQLAGIFANVIGVDGIGPDEDFCELGGHSLLALKLLADVARLTGATPPLRSLFQHPTVRGFAGVVGSPPNGSSPTGRTGEHRVHER